MWTVQHIRQSIYTYRRDEMTLRVIIDNAGTTLQLSDERLALCITLDQEAREALRAYVLYDLTPETPVPQQPNGQAHTPDDQDF